jgi:2-oxoglutarate ferredoxin oxidoreductase subunit gamma
LVCLTQAAYNAYSTIVRPGGLLLTDPRFVEIHRKIDAVQHEIPMFENIMEKIGKPIVFNICMLGAVIGLTATVKAESVLTTLATRIPENFLSMNQQALEMGLALTSNSN